MNYKVRNGNIEILRFLFCIGIVLLHAWVNPRGFIGVEFFFIVTGFFLAKKVDIQRKKDENTLPRMEELLRDAWKDILHRYRGIFPYFLVSTIIGTVVSVYAFQWDVQKQILFHIKLLPYDFLLLQNYGFQSPSIVGVVWYLTAMMLAVWLIYPIMRRFYKVFMYSAPFVSVTLMGIIIANCGTMDAPCTFLFGWVNTGFMRAISAITLGAFVYFLSEKIKKIQLKQSEKILVTILEIAGYVWVMDFIFTWKDENVYFDGIAVFMIAASFLLTTSQQSLLWGKFDNTFCIFLGKITVPIFLSHFYCVQRMPDILARMNIEMSQKRMTLLSLGMTAIVSGIVYVAGRWVDNKIKQLTIELNKRTIKQ